MCLLLGLNQSNDRICKVMKVCIKNAWKKHQESQGNINVQQDYYFVLLLFQRCNAIFILSFTKYKLDLVILGDFNFCDNVQII